MIFLSVSEFSFQADISLLTVFLVFYLFFNHIDDAVLQALGRYEKMIGFFHCPRLWSEPGTLLPHPYRSARFAVIRDRSV